MSINFYTEEVSGLHLSRTALRAWIKAVIGEERRKTGDISFIFCSDEYLLRINQQYLEHDYYTDIITFDDVSGDLISGDIFISVDRVRENAEIYGQSFSDELHRIIIHGVLHLLGYKDKQPDQKEIMTGKEDYYLSVRAF